ncbi:MAG TPA: hypothetical protein VIG33_06795, partial [Pseudobdellovibrionaceae bacterium]
KNKTYLVFVQVESPYLQVVNNRQASGLNHIAFQGVSLSHLNELEKDLNKRDIKILKKDERHICFEDPNKFAVEIFI